MLPVTVIIPAYNVEAYVGAAIDSVLTQAVPVQEIIVIDDGSTDATPEVLERYQAQENVRIVRTKNYGLSAARNLGIMQATGEYIYFMDSDDLLDKQFSDIIQSVLNGDSMSAPQPDIVCFGARSFVDKGVKSTFFPVYERQGVGRYLGRGASIAPLFSTKSFFSSACLHISRRELWKDRQLEFKAIVHEDEEIIIPLFAAASDVVVLGECLYHRRIRDGSIMTNGIGPKNIEGYRTNVASLLRYQRSEIAQIDGVGKVITHRLFSFTSMYLREVSKRGLAFDMIIVGKSLLALRSVEITWLFVKAWLSYGWVSCRQRFVQLGISLT